MKNLRWLTGILLVSLAWWFVSRAYHLPTHLGSAPGVSAYSNTTLSGSERSGTSSSYHFSSLAHTVEANHMPDLQEIEPQSQSTEQGRSRESVTRTQLVSESSNREILKRRSRSATPPNFLRNGRQGQQPEGPKTGSADYHTHSNSLFSDGQSASGNVPLKAPLSVDPSEASSFSIEKSGSGHVPLNVLPSPEIPAAWVDLGEQSGFAPEEVARIHEEAINLKALFEGSEYPLTSQEYLDLWNQSARDSDRWFRLRYGSRAWMRHHIAAHQMADLHPQVEE